MPTTSKYNFRLMEKDDYDQVLSLLTNSFFKDEPITQCLGITDTYDMSKTIIDGCLNDQCSFIAYDIETNQIIAICLNEIIHKNAKHESVTSNEQFRFIFQIFDDMHKNLNIFEELNASTLLHIFIISVDKSARGHGLASDLIGKSIQYGKELKIDGAYAEATNVYSLNCFKKLDFQVLFQLKYLDYNAQLLAKLNDEMHDRCYLVAKKF